MKRKSTKQTPADMFEMVRTVGLALPDVEATTKYDGSPVLKVGGSFIPRSPLHRSFHTISSKIGARTSALSPHEQRFIFHRGESDVMRTSNHLLALVGVLALAEVVATSPGPTAPAQTSDAVFSPAQRIVGSAPALPSPTTVGWIEEAVEVTVDKVGHPRTIVTLKGTPESQLLTPAIRGWIFRPASVAELPAESSVLVVGIFRPPQLFNGPALGTPPITFGVGSRGIPAPKLTPVPAYPPDSIADGVAVVELLVARDGRVQSARLVNAAPGFDAVTLAAARKWSFAPALREGQAVPAFVYLIFGFRRAVT